MVLPCAVEPRTPPPFGWSLMRSWLHHGKVMYMHTKTEAHVFNADDKNRTRVSGDPSSHSLNVTISDLRASDTDRYYCEFVVDNPSHEDLRLPGKTEFFLLVTAGELFVFVCFFLISSQRRFISFVTHRKFPKLPPTVTVKGRAETSACVTAAGGLTFKEWVWCSREATLSYTAYL